MTYKKFDNADLFYNTIKTKPRFEFKIWLGKAVVNNSGGEAVLNSLQTQAPSALIQPEIPVAISCSLLNAFDFSCPDNSYNIAII